MIDLTHTKEQMLAEINASATVFAHAIYDAADPDFVALDEVYLVVQGQTPDELLPVLNAAFAARYADVPAPQLYRHLLYLLKKAVGNAYKWGNHKDPAKRIRVEAVATRTGILVAISDQGEGFDVPGIVGQFRSGKHYFTHGGSGLKHFDRTKSLISYANGGRTLLLRFLCVLEPGKAMTAAASPTVGTASQAACLQAFQPTATGRTMKAQDL
jgi:hypothetical protein